MQRLSNRSRNMLPMNIMISYNLVTLVLFVFGAWNYKVTNYGTVIFVVLVSLFAFYMGYFLVIHSHKEYVIDESTYKKLNSTDSKVIKMLKKWTKISAILAIPDMLYYSRMWTFSPAQILQRLIIGLTESNLNYSLSLGYENSGTVLEKVVVILTVLLYTLKFAVLPLSIIYWKKIDGKQKTLCIFITVVEIIKWLLKGMNKGIFDYAFVFLASALLVIAINKRQRQSQYVSEVEGKQKRKAWIYIISIVALVLAVNVFISNIAARSSKLTTAYYSSSMQLTADPDNFFLRLLPVELHKPFLSLCMYLTCGYQGLSYALRLPFKWCFGIGNNQFTISNFRDVLGINVSSLTYQARVEQFYPWYEFHNWHTTYTWLANDFSFYLVPVVLFIWGVLFALSWLSAVEKHNPYAVIIFCLFIIRSAFLPANNVVLTSSFTFITWFVCMILWYLSSHGIGVRLGRIILFNQKY